MPARTLLAALMVAGCSGPAESPPVAIEIAAVGVDGVESGTPTVEPSGTLLAIARRGPGRWQAWVRPGARYRIRAAGACPVEIDGDARWARLPAAVRIEGERAQVGFGARFELRAVPACDVEVAWSADFPIEVAEEGRVVRGMMPTRDEAGVPASGEPGVIAISPRTRGTRTLWLTVDGVSHPVEVHAAARTTGVPSVAVGTRIYLGGEAPKLIGAPPESQSSIDPATASFRPDARGRYVFRAADGRSFSVFAGTHAATDLDCGRAECHRSEAEHARRSSMTTVFARKIEDPNHAPPCSIACHAVGEPGVVGDGGFSERAAELGVPIPLRGGPGEFELLPRELRRLAGVGCTGCHGPGAIPEPDARGRILRTEVCAFCHDAPPRYRHVEAWRRTRMGTRDAEPGTRLAGLCARCHSTEGFLSVEAAPRAEIGCAACHAPHGEDTGPHLLRRPSIEPGFEEALAEGPSRVCVSCHAPERGLDLPLASSAALVAGRFAFAPGGGVLAFAAPHARLPRGCLSCHGARPAGEAVAHDFAVDRAVCVPCHGDRDLSAPPEFRARVQALRARPDLAPSTVRPHPPADETARRRWNAGLLAADPAAWVHAGRGALQILEAAD